ncbi:hypothetical protein [Halobacterium salinarum]|uniref:Uncharacterized protein n=1 Tax=Halobacterium salinarum (strain ATCC 33171 / DSM 3754 / JCM 8978 / NBRC 102687 / NCIMB 764 / 91-R6) TaxID=2597657 RepID=A0A4D6GXD1_HALS9|nr:hypothetical protein [Halobacterium salinarum]MDL0144702.1 hypothetical protein [Halobacterium salinarum]QCC46151.1 uncharacterized protein HBSAL_13200 [Halobacterium salinarum]TYO73820.1 hypothetical protein APQ99_02358 [Halobacterium salinarum DSM 3754]
MNESSDPPTTKPPAPDLPNYILEPLDKQSPDRLDTVAAYAAKLAAWKRTEREHVATKKREENSITEAEQKELEEREISTDPTDYSDIPASGAYITVKETKPGYHYYYWQWRDGDSWKNEYIAPVNANKER